MAPEVRAPVVYLSHGAPLLAVEDDVVARMLERWGRELSLPAAIAVVSAHWEAAGPVRVGASARPELIYDFSGFPGALYGLRYPCPGDPELAGEIARRLSEAGAPAVTDARRGLDHGVWVPLLRAFPAARIPVVQISLPEPRSPGGLVALGKALAPLRERGILIVGSGGLVHNLRRVHLDEKDAPVDGWARAFDEWVHDRLRGPGRDELVAYRGAPGASLSVPTAEHLDPLFVVLGASSPQDRLRDLHAGFFYGNLSMRSFQFES